MRHLSIIISMLAVLLLFWFFQGCSESNESFQLDIIAPDQAAKEEIKTLKVYAIISSSDNANCQNLMNGSVSPDDGTNQAVDNESISDPLNTKFRPLKVPKKRDGTLLFFSQGEDANGAVIFLGCANSSSNPITITLQAIESIPPADVTSLTATPGDSQVVLNWQDPSGANFASIQITWSPNGSTIQPVTKGTQTYTAVGLTNNTEYTFTVKSVYSNNKVSEGATVLATPVSTTLAEVTSLTATPENSQVVLNWQDPPGADFSSIQITWSPNGSTIQPVTKGTQTYTAVGLTNNTEYTFTVKSVYSNNKVSEGVTVKATPQVIKDVYVSGEEMVDGKLYVAKVWKNDALIETLTNGALNGFANSVFVSGNDIYIAGEDGNVAKVWKNGALFETLIDGTYQSDANSVFVSGNDVYVAGQEFNGSSWIAKVWKNGTSTPLTDGTRFAYTHSVFVSGNDVYVAGNEFNGTVDVAKVWKNGTSTPLTNGTHYGYAYSVFVSGSDVYVAGKESSVAKVWKNNVLFETLTDGTQAAEASSIFVSGNDVYVAGYEYNGTNYVAKVWKNGTLFETLTDGTQGAVAYSIFVSDNDVYVAGFESNGTEYVAKVWKNGTSTPLTDGTYRAEANCVFVVVH